MTELGALRVETRIRHCLMNHHYNTKGLVSAYVRNCLTTKVYLLVQANRRAIVYRQPSAWQRGRAFVLLIGCVDVANLLLV
jgi:hypothetical protein